MEVFISEKIGRHFVHVEHAPNAIEAMQTLCDTQFVSSATLTARSDHEKHACLLEDTTQTVDLFAHFHSKKCDTNRLCEYVASQCLTTASTELNLEELRSATKALKCKPDEAIGLKWCNDEALSTASVMPLTAQVQLVTLKDRMITRAFPVYAEGATFNLPRCQCMSLVRDEYSCTHDMWRTPLVMNKQLLAQFLKVASLHRESEGQDTNTCVRLSCVRACTCSNSYNDLLVLSIKHGHCWARLDSRLQLCRISA
jgi:hypothetical protein